MLVFQDLMKTFEVEYDACHDCLGAILLQAGHAIAYEICHLHVEDHVLGIYEK